jgi:predicted metalloprotease with PDZ domain
LDVYLGCNFIKSAVGAKVRIVFDGGAAQKSGLSAGDILLALDGIKVTADGISDMLKRYRVGETVRIHFFRRDELLERELVLEGAPFKAYYLTMNDDDVECMERRRQWMYGTT